MPLKYIHTYIHTLGKAIRGRKASERAKGRGRKTAKRNEARNHQKCGGYRLESKQAESGVVKVVADKYGTIATSSGIHMII